VLNDADNNFAKNETSSQIVLYYVLMQMDISEEHLQRCTSMCE